MVAAGHDKLWQQALKAALCDCVGRAAVLFPVQQLQWRACRGLPTEAATHVVSFVWASDGLRGGKCASCAAAELASMVIAVLLPMSAAVCGQAGAGQLPCILSQQLQWQAQQGLHTEAATQGLKRAFSTSSCPSGSMHQPWSFELPPVPAVRRDLGLAAAPWSRHAALACSAVLLKWRLL